MKKIVLLLSLAIVSLSASAQLRLAQSQLINGIPDGIVKPVPSPVQFLDENRLLLFEPTRNTYYIYDTNTSSLKPYFGSETKRADNPEDKRIFGEEFHNVTYSPDGKYVAYTRNHDLYSMELATNRVTRYTNDGSDVILNGYSSWVYNEEIFGRPMNYRAFWWSPDSRRLVFFRFDDSQVPVYRTYSADGHFGSYEIWRYPQAGDTNPTARIGVVEVGNTNIVWADFETDSEQYFGTPFWNADGSRLIVSWMPRSQKDLKMYSVNPSDGSKMQIYSEHQNTFVNWPERYHFTDKGFYFVSDKDLWEQVYYINYDGSDYEQITNGTNWNLNIVSVDSKYLYYTARREKTTVNQIFKVTLSNRKKETLQMSYSDYNYSSVAISPSGNRFAAVYSNCKTPKKVLVMDCKKEDDWIVADSRGDKFYNYNMGNAEILFFSTSDGYRLPIKLIMPVGLDTTKKYPMHIDIYGGPDHSQVMDIWQDPSMANQWWANNGVIQVWLDNRASGHAGKKGINSVYGHLSEYEVRDFAEAVKFLLNRYPFIDGDKVGIEGFSFGGTMTALAVTEYSDFFKYGIAGGGVYDWSLYDSHYTERYMNTPQANPDGYARTVVMKHIENYAGDSSNMLLISHGTADDNVHFQNTLQLVEALQYNGKHFEMMIYPDQRHGYRGQQGKFFRRENMIFWYKYLLGKEIPSTLKDL